MKPGDLVRWTFAKLSKTYNRNNKFYMGILLKEEGLLWIGIID